MPFGKKPARTELLQALAFDPRDLGEDLARIIPGIEPEVTTPVPGPGSDKGGAFIPVCTPDLAGREVEYVMDCLNTGWISSQGKYIPMFEESFSEACGCRFGIACCNGTMSLHLVLAALGLEPGDEVILPAFTMIATINAVTYCGAAPVLVDSDPDTWTLDVRQLEDRITPRTRAIIPVHLYGHPADMDPVLELSRRHGLFVLEDAAQAHGAQYRDRRVGGLGHAGAFSFYANKIITTGEGGMVTTNDETMAHAARTLRDHAFSPDRHFWHRTLGYNYRMTNLQAAVGLAQTEQMDRFVALRRRNAALYTERLRGVPGLVLPPEADWARSVFWMYAILVEDAFGTTRDELRALLARNGVETRSFFVPMHLQPVYHRTFRGQRYPVAERLCGRGLYLPSASSLSVREIDFITDLIKRGRGKAEE